MSVVSFIGYAEAVESGNMLSSRKQAYLRLTSTLVDEDM